MGRSAGCVFRARAFVGRDLAASVVESAAGDDARQRRATDLGIAQNNLHKPAAVCAGAGTRNLCFDPDRGRGVLARDVERTLALGGPAAREFDRDFW